MSRHAQVKLSRGTERLTCWIPEPFAHIGKTIKLKQDDGSWDDGWHIDEVGARADSEYVAEHERDYKRQREASDV